MEENSKKTRGLGKGLSELLGEARAKAALSKQVKTEVPDDVSQKQPALDKPPVVDKQPKIETADDFSQELDALNNISDNSLSDNSDEDNNEVFNTGVDDSDTQQSEDINDFDYDDYTYDEDEDDDEDDVYETITENSFDTLEGNTLTPPMPTSVQNILQEKSEPTIKEPVKETVLNTMVPDTTSDVADNTIPIEHLPQKFFTASTPPKDMIHELPIELVNPNKEQPRKFFDTNELNDLASSIKIYGIIQPILVKKIDNEYMIVAGERRWRASQIAGLKKIPAIIVPYQDNEILEIALIENIQRANLTPLDEAQAYHYLMNKYSLTQFELSQRIGKSRSYIANILRLLELDDTVKNYLETGELSVGHAKVLVGVKNAADLAEKIVKSHMSVRKTEELISQLAQKQNARLPKALNTGKNTDILALEADLRAALGVNVSINTQSAQKGSLVIRYESLDQLDEVCRRLCSNWGAEVA